MREDNAAFGKEISERLASTLWEKKITARILTVHKRRKRSKILLTAASIVMAAGSALFWFGANEDVTITIAASIGGNDTSLPISEYFGLPSGLVLDEDISLGSIETILNE